MLGKLIAYGEDRAAAIARARTALDGYVIDGLATNRDLLAWVLEHPTFRAGTATTDFLGDAWRPGRPLSAPAPTVAAAAARLLANSPHWAIAGQGIRLFLANDADRAAPPVAVRADRQGPAVWLLTVGDVQFRADVDDDRVSIRDAGSDVHPTAYVVAYESDALVVRVDDEPLPAPSGATSERRRHPDARRVRTRRRARSADAGPRRPRDGRVRATR